MKEVQLNKTEEQEANAYERLRVKSREQEEGIVLGKNVKPGTPLGAGLGKNALQPVSGKQKAVRTLCGLLFSLCIIFTALVSSVEFVCYVLPGFFRREFERYDVLSQLPGMHMDGTGGLMDLTRHMMAYLRGDASAPDLQFMADMGGTIRPFFSERELLHMADVRALFVGAVHLRIAAVILAALLIVFLRTKSCKSWEGVLRCLTHGMLQGIAAFLVLSGLLAAVCAADFNLAFVTFHHLFFNNDLWLLDPSVDLLIRILPESFFFDTAAAILKTFLGSLAVLGALSGVLRWKLRKH